MIDPKSLRIGNWIESKMWIQNINKDGFIWNQWQVTAEDIPQIYDNANTIPDQYRPIPLSPDILERAGFMNVTDKIKDINIHYVLAQSGATIEFEVVNGRCFCFVERIPVDCDYLHQLQNLVSVLHVKELEIKLP
jgi:hypothetical protein